jgi:branched-chain amino acid transport system substrate-binding protein
MALKEINEMGGILGRTVDWVELDSADMSADKMIAGVDALATKNNVDFCVYGYTATYTPTYQEFAKFDLPFLHVDTCQEFADWVKANPDKAWLGWMGCAVERYYGTGFPVLLDSISSSGAWKPTTKTAAVVRGEDSYGQRIATGFIDEIKKRGWTITLDETATFGTVEFHPLLTKIRSNAPDVIFSTDWIPSDYATFVKQFMEDPIPALLYGQWAPAAPEFISLNGDKANGVIWSTLIGPLTRQGAQYQDPITKAWYDKYKAAYNTEPGDQGAICYDMTWMWATATALAGGPEDKKAVTDALSRMVYRGASGTYRFNDEHWPNPYPDIEVDPSLGMAHQYLQIQNQQNGMISPPPYGSVQFQLPWWFKQ